MSAKFEAGVTMKERVGTVYTMAPEVLEEEYTEKVSNGCEVRQGMRTGMGTSTPGYIMVSRVQVRALALVLESARARVCHVLRGIPWYLGYPPDAPQ